MRWSHSTIYNIQMEDQYGRTVYLKEEESFGQYYTMYKTKDGRDCYSFDHNYVEYGSEEDAMEEEREILRMDEEDE